jgi:hypothetical protein
VAKKAIATATPRRFEMSANKPALVGSGRRRVRSFSEKLGNVGTAAFQPGDCDAIKVEIIEARASEIAKLGKAFNHLLMVR